MRENSQFMNMKNIPRMLCAILWFSVILEVYVTFLHFNYNCSSPIRHLAPNENFLTVRTVVDETYDIN